MYDKIKTILIKYRSYCYVLIGVVVLACAWAYHSGRQSALRDVNIERVQRINEQLEQARDGIDSATRTNNEARSVVTNGIVINERIEQSIDRGQSANARTSESIAEAQRLIDESKQGFSESQRIISDSKSILERARARAQKGTEER